MLKERMLKDPTRLMDLDVGVLKGLGFSPPKEVEKPTYEVVGEIERYDIRDHVNARATLLSGTPEYEDYYKRFPEREAGDARRRKALKESRRKRVDADPINEQLAGATFYGREALGLPEIVLGQVYSPNRPPGGGSRERVEVDPKLMSRKIKALGLHLGATKVRITELNQKWVYTHYAHPYTPEPYGKPVDLNYKYIIAIAVWQEPFMMATGDKISENMEVGWKYSYASFICVLMAQFIRALGWPARALPQSNAPYLVPPVFVDTGIGEYGRCGFVVTKEFGNNFRPSAVATDMPLTIDKPVDFDLQDFCSKCKICAEACPSSAIPEGDKVVVRGIRRWHIDDEKCRGYWDAIGASCGICQAVCPFNHPNNLFHDSLREIATRISAMRSLLIWGENAFYHDKYLKAPLPEWINLK